MPIQIVTHANFEPLVKENDVVFIDFWAAWCAPCKFFSKVYEQVSHSYPEVVFAKVNIEEQQELANLFEIRSIPHLMIMKQGIVIYSDVGSISESTLRELAQQSLDIDVSDMWEREER